MTPSLLVPLAGTEDCVFEIPCIVEYSCRRYWKVGRAQGVAATVR
jgi:hypothetical protein